MSSYSKQKGKTYERDLAENLSNVFSLPFRRIPNSGAYIGGTNIIKAEELDSDQIVFYDGDLIVPKELSCFSFEAKFHKDIGKISSWFDGNSIIDDWIKQASNTKKKYWLLCFKLNNIGEFVLWNINNLCDIITVGNILIYKNDFKICRLNWSNGVFNINKEKMLKLNK